jgi:hypothetical protein
MRYVVVGYMLTYGALVSYVVWLTMRLRAARQKVGERA